MIRKCNNEDCRKKCICGVEIIIPTERTENVAGTHTEFVVDLQEVTNSVVNARQMALQELKNDVVIKAGADSLERIVNIRYETVNTMHDVKNFCIIVNTYGNAIYNISTL